MSSKTFNKIFIQNYLGFSTMHHPQAEFGEKEKRMEKRIILHIIPICIKVYGLMSKNTHVSPLGAYCKLTFKKIH